MLNRIIIFVMLIFMLFTQYAGVPLHGMTLNVAFAYHETGYSLYSSMEHEGSETIGTPAEPTATASPSASPAEPAPNSSPVPDAEPEASGPPLVPSPDETPFPQPPEIPDPESSEAEGPSLLGPLTDHLPSFDETSPKAVQFMQDMEDIINNAVKKSGIKTTYGIFIMDLGEKLYYGINENLTRTDPADNMTEGYFNSASVIKLFQGYLLCDMIRRGELDDEKVYFDRVTGRKFKLLPMIKHMISYSDNNYSNACLRLVGNKKSNEVLSRLGINNSRIYGEMSGAIGYSRQNNIEKYGTDKRCARITPLDAGLILYNVYLNKYTDPYMKVLNEGLLGNVYNTRIPVGVKRVSSKYYIAHKTGTNSALGVYNDAGIVYTKRPFILAAFAQGTTSNMGHSFIRSLAEQLTRYFEN